MSNADDYNAEQIGTNKLTTRHVTALVKHWQETHDLAVDGMAGPITLASIERSMTPAPFLGCPMPTLVDGRRAVITSEYRPADRPNHDGVDWFYAWEPGDKPDFVGDRGAAGKQADGRPKWVVPIGVCAVAAAEGVVQLASNSPTGWRVWIDHGNGLRSGYFHLLDIRVKPGQRVARGAQLGLVGDNPSDNDGRHLHFEVSPVATYNPINPELYLLPPE